LDSVRTEVEIDADIFEFVPRFFESRKKDIANLEAYLKADDFTSIAKIGHVIKGVSRPYGFPGLESLAVELEKAALSKDKKAATTAFDKMTVYLKKYSN
jgi:HPt (histidine-containing phosphotransfer) domain-containing protein